MQLPYVIRRPNRNYASHWLFEHYDARHRNGLRQGRRYQPEAASRTVGDGREQPHEVRRWERQQREVRLRRDNSFHDGCWLPRCHDGQCLLRLSYNQAGFRSIPSLAKSLSRPTSDAASRTVFRTGWSLSRSLRESRTGESCSRRIPSYPTDHMQIRMTAGGNVLRRAAFESRGAPQKIFAVRHLRCRCRDIRRAADVTNIRPLRHDANRGGD